MNLHTETSLDTLIAMLQVKRPHNSVSEHVFIRRFLEPYGVKRDAFGNRYLRIGAQPAILWSSHTDSCHRAAGPQQTVCKDGVVSIADPAQSNCLGADDAAGVWLMTEMIARGIPGLYVFHRGEERGGLGSRHFAEHNRALLSGIKAAIAFDRRGTDSIITHQRGARSCSDAFARCLSDAIGLGHMPDPTGTFTDTANYVDLVGECTNISVGYANEHTPEETLDLRYLLPLRDAILAADFSALVFMRQPGDYEPLDPPAWLDNHDTQDWSPRYPTLLDLVTDHPCAIATFLELSGVTARELSLSIDDDLPF